MGSLAREWRPRCRLFTAEGPLHCLEVLSCVLFSVSAVAHSEPLLAVFCLPALLMSAASLHFIRRSGQLFLWSSLREWLYVGIRVHHSWIWLYVQPIRLYKNTTLGLPTQAAAAVFTGGRGLLHTMQALCVHSSLLHSALHGVVLQLRLPLQLAVQVAVAAVTVRAMPAYCRKIEAEGVLPTDLAWVARVQGGLSSIVMAATSSSRNSALRGPVPCVVTLSHLALVLVLVVPVLVACFCGIQSSDLPGSSSSSNGHRSSLGGSSTRWTSSASPSASGSDCSLVSAQGLQLHGLPAAAHQTTPDASDAVTTTSSDCESRFGAPGSNDINGSGGGGSGGGGSSSEGSGRGRRHRHRHRRHDAALRHRTPSALLLLGFGAALSGILFDVLLTVHERWGLDGMIE